MDLSKIVHLDADEAVVIEYACSYPTKRQQVISSFENPSAIIFKGERKTLVDEPITLKGVLILTNRRLFFVGSKGLIFKNREAVLAIGLNDIVSVVTSGVIFKNLLIGVQKDGQVITHTFININGKEAQDEIKKIQSMALSNKLVNPLTETKPAEFSSSSSVEFDDKEKVVEKQETGISDTPEQPGYCAECGYGLVKSGNYCGGCGHGQQSDNLLSSVNGTMSKLHNSIFQTEKVDEVAQFCGNCGTDLEERKFCQKCGKPSSAKIRKCCTKCGAHTSKKDKFCVGCGKNVG